MPGRSHSEPPPAPHAPSADTVGARRPSDAETGAPSAHDASVPVSLAAETRAGATAGSAAAASATAVGRASARRRCTSITVCEPCVPSQLRRRPVSPSCAEHFSPKAHGVVRPELNALPASALAPALADALSSSAPSELASYGAILLTIAASSAARQLRDARHVLPPLPSPPPRPAQQTGDDTAGSPLLEFPGDAGIVHDAASPRRLELRGPPHTSVDSGSGAPGSSGRAMPVAVVAAGMSTTLHMHGVAVPPRAYTDGAPCPPPSPASAAAGSARRPMSPDEIAAARRRWWETLERIAPEPQPWRSLPIVTREEVARHASPDSCWLIVRKGVYDVTAFVQFHPGSPAAILRHAGQDATRDFDFHTQEAHRLWDRYRIARLAPEPGDSSCALL